MNSRLYYLVDFKWIRRPFYWDIGFLTLGQARASRDAYFPPSFYSIIRGDLLSHFKVKRRKAKRYMEITPLEKSIFPSRAYKREMKLQRIRGKNITPYKFKEIWEPQHERGKERRNKIRMKGRLHIRKQILK